MTADERGWRYVWNGENRMVCASNDEVVVTYAYDHRGRMVRKDILPTSTNSTSSILHSTFDYLWDGWNIVRETLVTPTSTNVTHNVWGLDLDGSFHGAGGVGGLLSVIRDNQFFSPTYDANGNISEYLGVNGSIAAHQEYDSFGNPIAESDNIGAFTHWFSTKPWCWIMGVHEYQLRKMNSDHAHFLSRDLIENIENQYYVFSRNNGINVFDFLGLSGENNPSSFLDGITEKEKAIEVINRQFPTDPKRAAQELRRWEKARGLRSSSLKSKIPKLVKKCNRKMMKGATHISSVLILAIEIILMPTEANADEDRVLWGIKYGVGSTGEIPFPLPDANSESAEQDEDPCETCSVTVEETEEMIP